MRQGCAEARGAHSRHLGGIAVTTAAVCVAGFLIPRCLIRGGRLEEGSVPLWGQRGASAQTGHSARGLG